MGNNPEGTTATKIFHFSVGGKGFENLVLVTDPKHVLYEKERVELPICEEMVLSIAEDGVLVPAIARKVGDVFEIMAGRQRYKNAVEAKRRYPDKKITIPIRPMSLKDYQALKASAIENAQRIQDSIVSRGEKCARMIESGYEESEICGIYGVEFSTIKNWVTVSESHGAVKDAVISGAISETTALKISRKPFDSQAELVAAEAEKGRKKPGRQKGDNRKRIRITATEKDGGGYDLKISKCTDLELATIQEAIDAQIDIRKAS